MFVNVSGTSIHRMIEWADKYSVVISIIDKQLVHIINDAIVAKEHSDDSEKMMEVLGGMTANAQEHFKAEESYMLKFHYPKYQYHREEHQNFSHKTIAYRNKVMDGYSQIAKEVFEYLKKWLFNHIPITDKKFVDCFKENGLK